MERLDKETEIFFRERNLEKDEFLIPVVVDQMMKDGDIKLNIQKTSAKWYGITYKEDLPLIREALKKYTDEGLYR